WDEEEAAPVFHLIEAAVILGHALVVGERVEGRKNRVARAVIKDELAAVPGKRAEINPRRVGESLILVRPDVRDELIDRQVSRRLDRCQWIRAFTRKESRKGAAGAENVSGVVGKRCVDGLSARILRAAERFLKGADLLIAQTGIRLGAFTG